MILFGATMVSSWASGKAKAKVKVVEHVIGQAKAGEKVVVKESVVIAGPFPKEKAKASSKVKASMSPLGTRMTALPILPIIQMTHGRITLGLGLTIHTKHNTIHTQAHLTMTRHSLTKPTKARKAKANRLTKAKPRLLAVIRGALRATTLVIQQDFAHSTRAKARARHTTSRDHSQGQ